jgi:predicted metal-dependent peptidase
MAGEVNGDQSDRDQEVNREMKHLDCGRTVKVLNALKARLPRGSVTRGRVNELLRSLR